jgi:hypothetical protein
MPPNFFLSGLSLTRSNESEKLEPLLSETEQPLVHLPQAQLDEKLTGILEQQKPDEEQESV